MYWWTNWFIMNFEIPENECEIIVSRSGGAGGQNVNKVNTKITLRWNVFLTKSISEAVKSRFIIRYQNRISEEGFVTIISQEHRTQKLNLDEAYQKLHDMIADVFFPPKIRKKTKPTNSSKMIK